MDEISLIFESKPYGWGLRGDPYMWDELKLAFENQPCSLRPKEFNELLEKIFNELIEQRGKNATDESVEIDGFPKSGMSGGYISLTWWKETGLPLLKKRYRQMCK